MNRPKVSVLIPAYNEAERIGKTVRGVQQSGVADEIIVIDDGSTDGTAELARMAGATVLFHPRRRGKGEALNYGIQVARGEILVFLDGDLGESAGELRRLVAPVLQGEADMTIARFPTVPGSGGFGLVKGLARWGIRCLTGLQMESPLSGQRALRREVVEEVGPLASGFGVELALTIDAARRGYRLLEVPVEMTHALTGRDLAGFLHRGRQFLHVWKALWPRFWAEVRKRGGRG